MFVLFLRFYFWWKVFVGEKNKMYSRSPILDGVGFF